MQLKILVVLLLTLSSCTAFASKEYKEALNKSEEAQEIEFNQISDNVTKLENANSEITNSINLLEGLPDDKKK